MDHSLLYTMQHQATGARSVNFAFSTEFQEGSLVSIFFNLLHNPYIQ